ncbi:MAG: hypothetical protein HYU52_10520 [Acidobacteria bacterium]|nr:hypothetical protein [Acidobacteriota bacterium]
MAEPVVVICSPGEEAAARGFCAAVEARDAECWSPARLTHDPPESVVDGQIRNAAALAVVTRNPLSHRREIELARAHAVAVVITSPDDALAAWSTTLGELQAAGALDTMESSAKAAGFRQPRVYIADDEEKHIEFIAENVSEAQVFVRFGLFDKAIGRLRTVLERAPRNLEAHDELLKIYLEESQHDNAAATAADYLDSLLFRGEEEAYAMLRSHLLSHGFAVDDGPPVAVGAAGGVFRTTRFHGAAAARLEDSAQRAASRSAASASPPSNDAISLAPEPLPLELPILRNFRPSQPALESTGIDADLNGIDFLLDHGLLDEARMRVDQLAHEHPDHAGVLERRARLDAAAGPRPGLALALSLDDDWGVPTVPPAEPVPTATGAATGAAPEQPFPGTDATKPVRTDTVVCSVFCALAVDEGDAFEIRVWLHLTTESEADGVAIVEDRREAAVLNAPVGRGESLTLSLSLPGLKIEGFPAVPITWAGAATSAMFKVSAPVGTADSQIEGWLTVGRRGEPIGDVPLRIRVA